MAMKLFGHEFNLSTGSLMDIFQEGRKIFNKMSGGSTQTAPSPTSEIRSEGPSTFTAAFSDEDEVAILSFIRLVDVDVFFFVRDLVKRMKEQDSPDFTVDGKKTGVKGQRRNSFLIRLVQLQQKIVEDIHDESEKGKGKQGQAKGQNDGSSSEQERVIRKTVRDDPRLTDKDARVLFLQWLYTLYLRHKLERKLTQPDLDATYVADEKAIDKVITDLESIGVLTIEPLSKKAKDSLTQFLKWAKGEGKEWLMSFDEDAIRLAWIIAGDGKGYDRAKATLEASGKTGSEITAELKREIRARLPATPAEAQARVREVRRNANPMWVTVAKVIGTLVVLYLILEPTIWSAISKFF